MKLVSIIGKHPTGPLEVLEYLFRRGEQPTELVLIGVKEPETIKTMEIVELAILSGIRDVIPVGLLIRRTFLSSSDIKSKTDFEDMKEVIDAVTDPGDYLDISSSPRLPAIAASMVAKEKGALLTYVPSEERERVEKAREALGKMDLKKEIETVKAGGKASEEALRLLEEVVLKKPKVIILT